MKMPEQEIKKSEENKSKEEIKKSKPNRKAIIGVCIVVGLAIVFVAANGLGVYKPEWNNGFSATVANFIPYPAATVNNSILTIESYKDNLATIDHFYQGQAGQSEQYTYDAGEVKKETLNILIENKIVQQLASKHDVGLPEEEVQTEYDKVVEQVGGAAEFSERIKTIYNITPEEFTEKSLRPNLLLAKLQEKYSTDDNIDQERKQSSGDAKQKADETLQQIKDGQDFAELAKEKSDDTYSAEQGGDLGFFGQGQMVPEFEEAAFALEKGAVSEVVRTQYGYHIIKVDDKRVNEEAQDEVSVRHILFTTENTFAEWFAEQKKAVNVRIFIKGYSWNEGEIKTD